MAEHNCGQHIGVREEDLVVVDMNEERVGPGSRFVAEAFHEHLDVYAAQPHLRVKSTLPTKFFVCLHPPQKNQTDTQTQRLKKTLTHNVARTQARKQHWKHDPQPNPDENSHPHPHSQPHLSLSHTRKHGRNPHVRTHSTT